MMEKIIDVSDNQGVIDWQQVSKHIGFAILRSVRGSGKLDYQFKANVEGCRKYGIGFDVYKYSYALTEAASIKEAQQVVAALQSVGCGPEVTVWWDMEDKSLRKLGKRQLTRNILAARKVIEAAGYTFDLYCNRDWYLNVLDVSRLDCRFWIARYPYNKVMQLNQDPEKRYVPTFVKNLMGWQYTSQGRVPGIKGNVDLSVLYM